jgi:uncharacterized protein with FMN-binding domain
MKKNQKTMISAATLAVLASSLAGACDSQQSQSLAQVATDVTLDFDASATAATDTGSPDSVLASGSGSAAGTGVTGAAYTDGTYTGSPGSTRWGDVQVSAVIQNGSITDIQFLSYPDGDTRSAEISSQATGMLIQEAITAQSADVQVISGATFTSQAFMQSLGSALSLAQ